ncbi:MAG: UPF0182 family protein [Candidatus Binatia bacterium]|jgi:uncharacterized protein
MKRTVPLLIAAVLVIALTVGAATLSGLLVDWLWFNMLGFGAVFVTTWGTKLIAFGVAAVLSAALLAFNGVLAARTLPPPQPRRLRLMRGDGVEGVPDILELTPENLPWRLIVVALAAVLGLFIGVAQAGNWETFLNWLYGVPFGRTDPLFGKDLGFYVFVLPAYGILRDWGILMVFLAIFMAGGVYWARGAIDVESGTPRVSPAAVRHLSALLAIFFIVKAADYFLQRYDLLLSNTGVVFGAAYTDVHVRLPLLIGLIGLSVVAAVLCLANFVKLGFRLPVAALVFVLGGSLLEGTVSGVFQSYRVKPDELRLESPYIASNIALTRYGFGLDPISSKPFPAKGKLTSEVLAANQTTIQNIRWWDPRPLLDTYRQLQEIRLYYDFHDVDIDRYTFNGTYQQVMLSARELNQEKLPPDAHTWINEHFKFTHGIGITMSPVNRFDEEGLPIFYVKDIPPASPVGLPIQRPEVYFGEETSNYVVVGGGTNEFDYAKGQENVYNTYAGRDGVSLGTMWRRALFAWYLGDFKLLISGNVTANSRILFRRMTQQRISQIAPFLHLDRDPYVVVSDGRLVWLQDAYTTSDALPYSQPAQRAGINYIRNSVKITLDAYDGTVVFYVADPEDPIVRTYQRIFPSLFRPLDAMPAALRQHIRYPEDLFILQAGMYGTYHMTDPEVFYNKEDQWSFPQESYGGQTITMQPYYTIMRLPDEAREEFILMLPMVPNNRDNMIAWLAARCDNPHYGTVIEYAFPKEKLIFGPAQVEARIDQDTTISQQLSLWNQTGSRVIRGNLLVIPIDDALLYFEPLYLRAEKRELPELKRLIASAGDRVVMSQTVEPLLAALFRGEEKQQPIVSAAAAPSAGTAAPAAEALRHYRQALDALRNGDWQTFGIEMNTLQKALEGAPQ